MRGLPTLRAFNRGAVQVDRIAATAEEYRRETMATLRVAFLSALVLELAATLGTAVVAVEIGIRLDRGGIALAPALAVLVLAPELYAPLRNAAAQFHASADGIAAAERVLAELDALPHAPAAAGVPPPGCATCRCGSSAPASPIRAAASLRSWRRRPERSPPASAWPWSARPGAARATLARLLLRFDRPPARPRARSATLDLDGVDLARWRELGGLAAPAAAPAAATIADAIRLGRPEASDAEVAEAAGRAGADASSAPSRTGTRPASETAAPASRPARCGASRSPGRCCATPSLLLLDEPTTNLDPEAARGGSPPRLRALPRDRTLVLITHDEALAAGASPTAPSASRAAASARPALAQRDGVSATATRPALVRIAALSRPHAAGWPPAARAWARSRSAPASASWRRPAT